MTSWVSKSCRLWVPLPRGVYLESIWIFKKYIYKSKIWHLNISRRTSLLTNFINWEKFLPWRAAWMRQIHSLVVLFLDCFLYHQNAILGKQHFISQSHFVWEYQSAKNKSKELFKARDKTWFTLKTLQTCEWLKNNMFIPFWRRLKTFLLRQKGLDSMFIKKLLKSLPSLCKSNNTTPPFNSVILRLNQILFEVSLFFPIFF